MVKYSEHSSYSDIEPTRIDSCIVHAAISSIMKNTLFMSHMALASFICLVQYVTEMSTHCIRDKLILIKFAQCKFF